MLGKSGEAVKREESSELEISFTVSKCRRFYKNNVL